jgi:bifunctional pyridoxal-dependent enzyme with beta-cystathionase and maltose regulon repressor activities
MRYAVIWKRICTILRGIEQRFSESELAAASGDLSCLDRSRPLNIDDKALQKVLIEQQKVAIMPGYTYGEEGNGFVRLNAGCPRSKLSKGFNASLPGLTRCCNGFAQRNIPLRK